MLPGSVVACNLPGFSTMFYVTTIVKNLTDIQFIPAGNQMDCSNFYSCNIFGQVERTIV